MALMSIQKKEPPSVLLGGLCCKTSVAYESVSDAAYSEIMKSGNMLIKLQ